MDKAILKKFAIESRQDLMQKMESKIKSFYIDEEFSKSQNGDVYVLSNDKHSLSLTKEEFDKRETLIKRIKELGMEQVIEESAYTWFNRIVAIRYMEINDYLPLTKDNQSLGIRVLSSKDNTPDPEILKFTNLTNPDLDIDFKKEKYADMKTDNEKFKYILLLVCKKLGKVIPQVFDGVTDYIDILIPDNLLNDTGFVNKIVNEVSENNYNQVEIIGWLYQYYNQSEKDRVIMAKKTYKKNEIAYATQLFTPDWIVKYMVENSLGRYWIENNGDSSIVKNWKYFINDNISKKNDMNLQKIKFIDPCSGSGHILVYAFELLYQMYQAEGYNKKDITEMILTNNLYGLDIDDRASQLSVLSILLKAREYDKNIFNKEITKKMNILSIYESNDISEYLIENITDVNVKNELNEIIETYKNAKEIGSLLNVDEKKYELLEKYINDDNTIFGIELREKILPLIKQHRLLNTKYSIVTTNPPYMGFKYIPANLKKYIEKNYKKYKSDLYSCFIIKCVNMLEKAGLSSFVSPYSWMFLDSYYDLRNEIVNNNSICSLIQLEFNSFEVAAIPVCTYVISSSNENNIGTYIKLSDYPGVDIQSEKVLYALNNECNYLYKYDKNNFNKIKGLPIAFWLSESFLKVFEDNPKLISFGKPCTGLQTSDNKRFVRLWFEVENDKISYNTKSTDETKSNNKKWYPYNKGGYFRKWYGNNEYIVNWENDGYEIKEYNKYLNSTRSSSIGIANTQYYFKPGLTWTFISIDVGVRYFPNGYIFDVAGSSLFLEEKYQKYILAIMCSNLMKIFLQILNPTMNVQVGNICDLPIVYDENIEKQIDENVDKCIEISKDDWDMIETSWDFKKHILIENNRDNKKIEKVYEEASKKLEDRFNELKNLENKINKLLINSYKLENEVSSEVFDKYITIKKPNKERDIKSFISYAIGCMFGRYSLDQDGLVYAGGDFDESKYKTFKADTDNVIPITDEAYFADDIVERFKKFVEVVYGKETLNENIDFIAETLGKKGTETSEETIRRYFLNDFYADHLKTYQKRPIYWLFDSGKKNGFKALIYMHRYNENTIPKVRLDYLHRIQTTYDKLLSDVNYKLTTDLSMTDKKAAQNRQADLNAKLQEINEYDEKIAHIANQKISIDLDDGVKVNYDKFKDILAKIK